VVPAIVPLAIPEDGSIVATELLLLLHTPPLNALLNVVIRPVHTDDTPVIAPGVVLTVMPIVAVQPVGKV